jgi:hypothetical protein
MGPRFGFGGFCGRGALKGTLLTRGHIAYRNAIPTEQTPTGTAKVIYPDHHSHRRVAARIRDPAGDAFRSDIDLQNVKIRIPGIHWAAPLAHLIGQGRAGQPEQNGHAH